MRDLAWSRRSVLLGGAGVALGSACGASPSPDGKSPTAEPQADGASSKWARGGTKSIGASYPDPFAAGVSAACNLTCVRTLGPCYARTIDRKDISEGRPGLPVRLAFLIVDPSCKPVPGATVDIWHAASSGLYSADDTAQMCNGGDADAKAHRFFRGMQAADAKGRVDFDTCFPGWYNGRAVHIHFTVRVKGEEYVTSQLFFPTPLLTEIYASHPDYAPRGQPDTPTEKDDIAGADPSALTLDVQRMEDGVMLASKSIVLRTALTEKICGDVGPAGGPDGPGPGGPPPGGPGGPPPGGPGGPPPGGPRPPGSGNPTHL